MSKRTPLLIIGVLPPAVCAAAAVTVQAARALSTGFSVTVLLSDTAPPVDMFQNNPGINIIRMRDLAASCAAYQTHRRLYILDDSYQSLFALELYQQSPGVVWAPAGTLNQLVHDYFASQAGWPETYSKWLARQLGDEGKTIAHGLLHHRRLSKTLPDEMPDLNSDGLPELNEGTLISGADVFLPAPLYTLNLPVTTARDQCRASLGIEADTILVLSTDKGAERAAADTLGRLQQPNSTKLHFKFVSGGEDNLASLVAAADIVLDMSVTKHCPMTIAVAFAQSKAMIICSKPWSAGLSAHCCIRLPHANALHQMVAAVAVLAQDIPLRKWYIHNMKAALDHSHIPDVSDLLVARLRTKQPALTLPSTATAPALANAGGEKPPKEKAEGNPKAKISGASLCPGPSRSVALIGAVPPRPLVEKFFPEVDWETSPRFATPALARILCADQPDQAANKLALLGYSTPVIADENTNEKGESGSKTSKSQCSWRNIQPDLRATSEALAFGCTIEGATRADFLMTENSSAGYRLDLVFTENESPNILKHYEESCGLFWQLDPIRHHIKCMVVAGIVGDYQLTVENTGHTMMVSDAVQTTTLSKDRPVIISTNNHGVLSFILSALDSATLAPQSHDFLTKTLAHSGLNLEWLNHG